MKQDLERNNQKTLEDQEKRFAALANGLVDKAKVATQDMIDKSKQQLAQSGNDTMEKLVTPLKETIFKMEQTMNSTTLEQTKTNSALKEALNQAINSNASAKKTADDLIRAFRHEPKIQGDWGERVLEELLEANNLTEGTHFDVQETLRDANGRVIVSEETNGRLRPDVIVHVDAEKDVIVDSKVSMTDFVEYKSAEDPSQRDAFLKKHVESLKNHVKELAKKDYSRYVKAPKTTMDFVIMFVPNSAALWAALEVEPSLWRDAMEKNVFIADEQTLYVAFRMVQLTWRQIEQAKNQQKVFVLANEMLLRVGQFVKQMRIIGDSLEKAQKAYQTGMAKFADQGQSVMTTCRKLQQLGGKPDERYPLPSDAERQEFISHEDDGSQAAAAETNTGGTAGCC